MLSLSNTFWTGHQYSVQFGFEIQAIHCSLIGALVQIPPNPKRPSGTIACSKGIWQIGRHRAGDLERSADAARHASLRRQRLCGRDAGRWRVAFVAERPEKRRSETRGEQQMSATLKVTHQAIGAEVRRGTYDVVVDGERRGSVEMNGTIEIPVAPGRHTLQVRSGRNSSSTQTFDATEGEIVAFRCTGKRFLPLFLASFVVPGLALKLVRD